ncbi:MAG: D-alanyl-D-alanine carboxypeptidase [Rhizobiales bacterium]|nr:D-alanyl-D-alanine carboxypeptidase [Hyphomicrobiales bacterium]
MVTFTPKPTAVPAVAIAFTIVALLATATRASAEATLLIEADTGKVLHAENATYPWYPASVTKMMTAYVTLRAVKERRLAIDTLINVSQNAVAQQPTKMGFKAGTQVTVDNALKMLMVKSANDMAVALAEAVSGSIEKFADNMNRNAKRLGMTQSSFVNPNGLPADNQVTSARDLAILARAMIKEMPEYDSYWHIPAIQLGKRVMRNYNSLIDRYPGADGMKTGFICASGFNLVASATRNGRRLIAVVLGAPSSGVRAVKTAQLLEHGFNGGQLSWLTPSLGTVNQLVPINAAPPNLRDEMCGKHRKRPAAETEDEEPIDAKFDPGSPQSVALSSLRAPIKMSELLGQSNGSSQPVVVYIGPAKSSPAQPATTSAKSKRNASPAIPAAPAATNAINAAAPKAAPAAPQQLPTTAFAAVGDAPITTPSTFVAPAAAAEAPRPAAVPIPRPRPSGKR